MSSTNYAVIIEEFAQRHFIKGFAKKHKGAWSLTLEAIVEECKKIDILFLKSIAECITDKDAPVSICKTEFRISGSQESRHGSGNRCIVAVHRDAMKVHVLLVYHKNDIGSGNETAAWKKMIKGAYPEYGHLL